MKQWLFRAPSLVEMGLGGQADEALVRSLEVGNTFAFPSCAGSVFEDLGDKRDGTVVIAAPLSE